MQSYAFVLAVVLVATVQGFAPISEGRSGTQLQASLFDRISNMDLFAPKADQNTYGARNKKDLRIGKITSKSYVPSGLTAKQYEDIRNKQVKKKADNYAKNVAKAGVFEDYTDFYIKRGTDLSQDWAKNKATLGHRMAKTKYDWAGTPGQSFQSSGARKVDDSKKKKKKGKFSFGKL